MEFISSLLDGGWATQALILGLVAVGAIIAFLGISSSLSERSTAAERMMPSRQRQNLARTTTNDLEGEAPVGLSAALIPSDASERFEVGQVLAKSGFRGKNAIAGYYFLRLMLATSLPLLFILLLNWQPANSVGNSIGKYMSSLDLMEIIRNVAILCAVGFFGPQYWMNARIKERKRLMENAFPNMLDLLQIGVEAGMGFDQALLKVAVEMQLVSPEMSEEILIALSEIQAGRDRDTALMRMARRTGIEEMSSFVSVVLQSTRFGVPLAAALNTYAEEMRELRELRAQEMANKLPVKMSGVMAFLMLPAIAGLILTPIFIRYAETFGN
ncbi:MULTISPECIES: type II secretion system F family protein [unclassified Ruegeria]|uniref:type II secretion system F family protein n=1 Tax=unclassified Ruegeria TaxID=2625375 RepID=UPI00148883B4|nr:MULTISPECIES: type II secretion system F family protein [unclassified Ruegeria]